MVEQIPTRDTRHILKGGKVTPLFRSTLEDVFSSYVTAARFWADRKGRVREDYGIRQVLLGGSILIGNDQSDLDIIMIGDKLDQNDYRFFKMVLSEEFYNNKQKMQAIDVFVRPHDEFPEKKSYDVTNQVGDIVTAGNLRLSRD